MVNIISAIGINGEYSKDGQLPWDRTQEYAKADMKFFREYTLDKKIIMGYGTWVSIGCKPLPRRINIIITSHKIPGMITFNKLEDALIAHPDAIVIGGLDIIREICTKHIHLVKEIIINRFHNEFEADKILDLRLIPMIYQKIDGNHYTQLRYFWP